MLWRTMSIPRSVSKRIADRLKRHKAVVVVANKGKASRVFAIEEYLEKSKLAEEETERGYSGADGTGRQFLFHRQVNLVRADLLRTEHFW